MFVNTETRLRIQKCIEEFKIAKQLVEICISRDYYGRIFEMVSSKKRQHSGWLWRSILFAAITSPTLY